VAVSIADLAELLKIPFPYRSSEEDCWVRSNRSE
jgi:hypothetical protein